ncbi:MAG: autotransporter assembly complex family protein [Albidovulum sp.]
MKKAVAPACFALVLTSGFAHALDRFEFVTRGAEDALRDALLASSLVAKAEAENTTDDQSLFAAARADYGRLVGALYADGYYSGVVHILIDGKEAGDIAPLDAPVAIHSIKVSVVPGPRFTFSRARMKPYAKGTKLPPLYGDTKPALSSAIVDAATAGVEGWRNIGHAKAEVADQKIIADHRNATIDAEILLQPGPRVRFGHLNMQGYERMDPVRLARIAGFPTGEVFDPAKLEKVAKRLRRTGVFQSVAVQEAENLGPGDTLDVDLTVVEEKLHRYGIGAEISSSDGLNLSGYWLHRNLFGGAERLRVDGAIEHIGGQNVQLGYDLGVRIDRPATPVTDASAFIEARATRSEQTQLTNLTLDSLSFSFGLSRVFGDYLSAEAGISYIDETASDSAGNRKFRNLALPISVVWDNRDSALNTRKGYYLDAGVTPFLGFSTTGSGAQVTADARAYRGFGERIVLAGRLQLGTVIGPNLMATPPGYLFYSGGGGTVRGQPYQSLGIPIARSAAVTVLSGGSSFVGFSGEIRAGITDKIGAVAFYDAGYIGIGDLFGGSGEWHSGAGLGLRYDTGIGPIRFDVGLPVSGSTDDGAQIYVGIGQAF